LPSSSESLSLELLPSDEEPLEEELSLLLLPSLSEELPSLAELLVPDEDSSEDEVSLLLLSSLSIDESEIVALFFFFRLICTTDGGFFSAFSIRKGGKAPVASFVMESLDRFFKFIFSDMRRGCIFLTDFLSKSFGVALMFVGDFSDAFACRFLGFASSLGLGMRVSETFKDAFLRDSFTFSAIFPMQNDDRVKDAGEGGIYTEDSSNSVGAESTFLRIVIRGGFDCPFSPESLHSIFCSIMMFSIEEGVKHFFNLFISIKFFGGELPLYEAADEVLFVGEFREALGFVISDGI